MGQHCNVCGHPERSTIDARLIAGESRRQIGADYDLTEASLRRHHQAHVTDAVREDDSIMGPVTTTTPAATTNVLPDAPVAEPLIDTGASAPTPARTLGVVIAEQQLVDQAIRQAQAARPDRERVTLNLHILNERWHALEVERLTLEIDAGTVHADTATAAVVPVEATLREAEMVYQTAKAAFESAQRAFDERNRHASKHRIRVVELRRKQKQAQEQFETAQRRLVEAEREAGIRHREDLQHPANVQRLGRIAQAMATP